MSFWRDKVRGDESVTQPRPSSEVIEELESLLAHARPVPLTDQVRLGLKEAQALVAELRAALEAEGRW